jgi:hypothetical protein
MALWDFASRISQVWALMAVTAALLYSATAPSVAGPVSMYDHGSILRLLSTTAQPIHCRRYLHRHRTCVRRNRGSCVAWRTWTHRC